MTRLGEGHGLRLFPFPRAFPVIASVATPEPRRRRPQANVTPIPNRCQLEPIASPCRFEHFQALARSTRGNRASRPIGRGRRRRPRVSSRRPSNSEWRIVRSASPSPFAIRYSPSASYQHAQPFRMRETIMAHFVIFEKREIIIGFSNCEGIADRRPPRREQKPRGREMVAKPRSPREPAMNSARTGETRPP